MQAGSLNSVALLTDRHVAEQRGTVPILASSNELLAEVLKTNVRTCYSDTGLTVMSRKSLLPS